MDRAAADDREDLVADPLQPQAALDSRPVELGELDRARQAEEVRRVEEVHVEGVALDPLPAVQEAAQRADLRLHLDAEQALEGVDGGQLVGDRADPADPGDDVDDLVGGTPDDEPLEEARRLEDPRAGPPRPRRPGRAGGALPSPSTRVSSSTAYDALVSCVHRAPPGDGSPSGRAAPPAGIAARNGSAQPVKPANRRPASSGDSPARSKRVASATTFGCSRGPKQP